MKRLCRRLTALAVLAGTVAVVPGASALDLPVAGSTPLPSAPQVSNPLPPLSTAVPVPAPVQAPAPSVAQPVLPGPVAAPGLTPPPLRSVAVRTPSAPALPSAAPAASAPTPAERRQEVRRQRAARQTRHVHRAVVRMRGCLSSLGRRQRRYLTLRAGMGSRPSLDRGAAAERVGLPRSHARRFERRALVALRRICGGHDSGRAVANSVHTYFVVAGVGQGPVASTPLMAQVSDAGPGEQRVLSERRSGGERPPADGNRSVPGQPARSLPPATASVAEPPDGDSAGAPVWVAAALAALAALAGASLVRGRRRGDPAVVAGNGAAVVPAAAAASPVKLSGRQERALVRRALRALSEGSLESAAALVHPDVRWPDPGNGEVAGRDAFESYWSERLQNVDVEVEPLNFEQQADELVVEVNEVIRKRSDGTHIGEYHAVRRFRFRDGLIAEMRHGRP